MKKQTIILVLILIALGLAAVVVYSRLQPPNRGFIEAPAACTLEAKLCSDGSYVGRTGPNCEFTKCPGSSQSSGECFIGGCSNQICSDQEGAVSTCEYREEYACYRSARCERQASGQCGWTMTPELSVCLSNS